MYIISVNIIICGLLYSPYKVKNKKLILLNTGGKEGNLMTEMNVTVTTTEEATSVAVEPTSTIYLDKFGFMHSSREEALEANRT